MSYPKRRERAYHVPSNCRATAVLAVLYDRRSQGRLLSSFAVAANDLDPIRLDCDIILHLEIHILNQEGPHLIAEAVSVKVALDRRC
jgi:hypothetical protein